LIIADIGTGSGCIAIALGKELPSAKIFALDISPGALKVAQRNAIRLAASIPGLADRVTFLESNLLSALAERTSQIFDLIVSNPPYVGKREAETLEREVRDHEPGLHSAAKRLRVLRRPGTQPPYISSWRPAGPRTGPRLPGRGRSSTLLHGPISVTNDLAGIPRVIAAEKS
jgi:release factor glutamine methyltransferase